MSDNAVMGSWLLVFARFISPIIKHRAPTTVLAAVLLGASGCSWFTDFKQQPKIDPWESLADTIPPRGNPQTSVPMYGTAAPGYEYGRAQLPNVIDSMSSIPNPVAPDARSLRNGRINFQINCAVCHGPLAHGDGPATKYGMAGINLTLDVTRNRTDGYIFGMIRNGRGLMPTYNRIEEPDRWDIVNYVRSLQGRFGAVPDTTHGFPGENGTTVPGPSISAPTRPAPYYHMIYPQAGTQPGAPATAAPAPNVAPGAATPATPRDTMRAGRAADSTRRRP
ncbi:MAG TPA: cytochrome c [Gemmatimonadaceae bacterium]